MEKVIGNLSTLYRPTKFSEVVGQDLAVSALKKIAMADGIVCRSIFLKGSYGSGKCVPGNVRVVTDKGYIKIEDLYNKPKEGFNPCTFKVLTSFGFRDIDYFYYEKSKIVRRFYLSNGSFIEGTLKHRVLSDKFGYLEYCDKNKALISIGLLNVGDSIILSSVCTEFNNSLDVLNSQNLSSNEKLLRSSLLSRKSYFLKRLVYANDVYTCLTLDNNDTTFIYDLALTLGCIGEISWDKYKVQFDKKSIEFVKNIGASNINDYETTLKVKILSVVDYNADVYDVSVPVLHNFYAQGTINHNTTLAKIFGRAMNCEKFKETGDVCNECDACKEASARNSQTYYEFDSSTVGSIDGIRNLQSLFERPSIGRRVLVFDEVQAATKAALNALLKVIEDGVPNTVFVFCSTEDILETIKSRSLCIDIGIIPLDLIKKRVKFVMDQRGDSMSDENLNILAIKSKGHMRNALSLLQFYELSGEKALSSSFLLVKKFLIETLKKSTRSKSIEYISEIMSYNVTDIVNSIDVFIRSLFISESGTTENILLNNGAARMLFGYFYSPVVRQAMKDEVGLEIVLREFHDKIMKLTK